MTADSRRPTLTNIVVRNHISPRYQSHLQSYTNKKGRKKNAGVLVIADWHIQVPSRLRSPCRYRKRLRTYGRILPNPIWRLGLLRTHACGNHRYDVEHQSGTDVVTHQREAGNICSKSFPAHSIAHCHRGTFGALVLMGLQPLLGAFFRYRWP